MMTTVNLEHVLEKVDEDSLMNFTKEISKEVRLSGSDEEYRAFQYAEKQLKSSGFDTHLYKRNAYISLPEYAYLNVNGQTFDSITHSMAVSTDQEVESELIYVGEGSINDFQQKDVKDKVVIIDGLATPGGVQQAEKFGVKAAVFINAEYTHEMIVSTNWGNPDFNNVDNYPTIPVLSVNYNDGQSILEDIENNTSNICRLKTKVKTDWVEIPTLIAEYKGDTDPENFVLYSGHIDSWHYGVMDNGTANATMLEVARIIGAYQLPLYRSLRLAFWSGHSHGRYAGSAMYVDENWEELYDHCVMHVNIDSVGAKDAVVLTEGNAMAETKEVVAKSIRDITGEEYQSSRYGRSGDQSFWGVGVPSLLMGLSEQEPSDTPAMKAFSKLFGDGKGGGFGWWWHTTEDTIDKIDPKNLKRDCQIYLSIILNICQKPILPLNQLKAVNEMEHTIEDYVQIYPQHTGLKRALSRIKETKHLVSSLLRLIDHTSEDSQSHFINKALMRVSKTLVRLNYVNDDEFNHDPALSQPPVPLLADVIKLKEPNLTKEQINVIETTLLRKSNKFNFLLRELIRDLNHYIAQLEGELNE